MKTAKKLLCLALVIVMAAGFVTFAAAKDASEYTDIDSVDPAALEALYVFTALGITEGYPEGNFGPKTSFTRAEAAKIIATMLTGASASLLQPNDTLFKDVPKGHWWCNMIRTYLSYVLILIGKRRFMPLSEKR